jgi:hypothetical protein
MPSFPTLSHLRELGVIVLVTVASGAHEAADGAALTTRQFINQAKGKRGGSLGQAPVPIGRTGLLAAQGGQQLLEGGV